MDEATDALDSSIPGQGPPLYDAFLSYAHRDKRVTVAIHKGLHRIGRRAGRLRAARVFRDDTDLTASPDLWRSVTEAMDRARFMIVVLSPQAAESYWVNREVEYWLDHRGPDHLMLAVAQGHLVWDADQARFDPGRSDASPPVLTRPRSLPCEPLYIDVSTDAPWDLRSLAFRDKVTALAAPLHGIPKTELASDDLHEQRRFRRLRAAAISALVTLTVIAAATATTVAERRQGLSNVLNDTEPLSYAAGELYTALSVADAAAATAFIADREPREVRQRYEQSLTDAAVALTRASSGLTDEPTQLLLARIIARLAVYNGLIETARAHNRAGNVIGPSYLSEASTLMQHQILPDAQHLYDDLSGRMTDNIGGSTRVPMPVLVIVGVMLLFAVCSSRWWVRRTHRRVNIGFAAAGLTLVIMMGWVGVAMAICIADSRSAKNTADSLKTITGLAISAQQARADETLALIRRGDENSRRRSFYQRVALMRRELVEYMASSGAVARSDLAGAVQLLDQWRAAVDGTNAYVPSGNYWASTARNGELASTRAYEMLEKAFDGGIHESRRQLRSDIADARGGLTGTTAGTVILSVVAAVAVTGGLWPRLNE
ncbi:MAG: hypothetical protein QOH57_5386 [Mycobacterium sp.]|jgi:hypothetical protein|nr:hypothetical protein [Mycobacterium sp.]